MPRYFFDIDAGGRQRRDEIGMDLATFQDVEAETHRFVHDLAYAEILNGKDRNIAATVRNADGATIYRGWMTLTVEIASSDDCLI